MAKRLHGDRDRFEGFISLSQEDEVTWALPESTIDSNSADGNELRAVTQQRAPVSLFASQRSKTRYFVASLVFSQSSDFYWSCQAIFYFEGEQTATAVL